MHICTALDQFYYISIRAPPCFVVWNRERSSMTPHQSLILFPVVTESWKSVRIQEMAWPPISLPEQKVRGLGSTRNAFLMHFLG
jgi:hypothetical protein